MKLHPQPLDFYSHPFSSDRSVTIAIVLFANTELTAENFVVFPKPNKSTASQAAPWLET
jgi:hypothetical protein